jgi:hypothetical protein
MSTQNKQQILENYFGTSVEEVKNEEFKIKNKNMKWIAYDSVSVKSRLQLAKFYMKMWNVYTLQAAVQLITTRGIEFGLQEDNDITYLKGFREKLQKPQPQQ